MNTTKKSTDELHFGAFSDHDAQVDVNKPKKVERISLQSSADRRKTLDVKRTLTADDVLEMMRKQMGDRTQTAYANELGITPQYLCDILQRRRDPGPKVLSRLGLTQSVKYERTA